MSRVPDHVQEYNLTHDVAVHGRHFDDPEFDSTQESVGMYAPKPERKTDDSLIDFLRQQTWSDFARSLVKGYERYGSLTERQEQAARSMMEKTKAREAGRKRQEEVLDDAVGLDISALPAGLFAVPGGDTRLKVRVDRPDSGKWAGFVFVKDAAVYGAGRRYGMARPDGKYRGDIQDALTAIMADVAGARKAYGDLTGRCAICNRQLEDETSVAYGIGPVCREKVGL